MVVFYMCFTIVKVLHVPHHVSFAQWPGPQARYYYPYLFLLFSCSVVSDSATPWTAAHKAFLSFTISWSLLKLMFIESNYLVLFCSCLQFFPASGSFLMSQFQSIEASTSVLPMNIQDWFPLGLTGLISLQSKGLSVVFSSTTIQKHQFFSAQPSLWSNSHIHTWPLENHSFD